MKFYKNIMSNTVAVITLLFSFSSSATTVQFETNMGNFEIDLYDEATPKSVENFLAYVNAKAYDNSIIHRSVKDFVIQGGGFNYEGEVPLPEIPANDPVINEPGKSNLRGTIAYAKKANDPNSATTGWFINLGDNSENLDNQNEGFTVFGEVTGEGMTVIDSIAALSVFNGGGAFATLPLRDFTKGNTPNDANFVIITSVKIIDSTIVVEEPVVEEPIVEEPVVEEPVVEEPVVEPKKSSGGGSIELFFILLLLSGFVLRRFIAFSNVKVHILSIKK